MWKIYCDSYLLHATNIDDYKVFNPKLDLELNKTGSFTFTIYPDHANYSRIQKLKSIITVFHNGDLRFRGRVIDDVVGFYNERSVSCEGELAYLIDSVQRPFKFPVNDGDPATPADYFSFLIGRHNEQVPEEHRFVVGSVTVTDSNNYISRSDSQYETTWNLINSGLINTNGGFLWVDSDDSGNRRINYLEDFNLLSNQEIRFGLNLLSISTKREGSEIATAIVPLGSQDEETGDRLLISSLADEETDDICKSGDMVYSKVAEEYYGGRITKVVLWDNVTEKSNLLRKAKEKLADLVMQTNTIDISAADISEAGYDVNTIQLGTYVSIISKPHSQNHGIESKYLVKKLIINIEDPSTNTIQLGATSKSFTEQNLSNVNDRITRVESNATINQAKAIREVEQRNSSIIQQLPETIISKVSEEFYDKNQTNALVESLSTSVTQTKSDLTIRFEKLETDVSGNKTSSDASFEEIRKFIRFVDGTIVLGEEGNNQTQVITNTRNEFREGNAVVAYIGDRKLYIYDGEFLNSLKIGKFKFLPRANGNLSFKKVE